MLQLRNHYKEDKLFTKDENKTYKDGMDTDSKVDKSKSTVVNNDYAK